MQRAVRGALSIAAVVTVVCLSPTPAIAQPAAPPSPTNASDALKQYQDLSTQAEKAAEDWLAAQNDLTTKQAELDKATADLAKSKDTETKAHALEEQFRGKVDALAAASFQGARFNNLSALLSGGSQQDFLDRASALAILASGNREALDTFTGAVDTAAAARTSAADAQRRSQEAKAAAEQLANQITAAKADLEVRKTAAQDLYKKLSGKMYSWGAAGPNTFDCSGLVMYAYNAAGVGLPHSSRAQYTYGKSVAYGQWVSGDLLFFGSSAGSIHHVAIYIGNGKIVHASTSGQPVKVVPVTSGGSDYYGAKRIVG